MYGSPHTNLFEIHFKTEVADLRVQTTHWWVVVVVVGGDGGHHGGG